MTDGLCHTLPVLFSGFFSRKMLPPQTWDCPIFADVPSTSQGNNRGAKSNIQNSGKREFTFLLIVEKIPHAFTVLLAIQK